MRVPVLKNMHSRNRGAVLVRVPNPKNIQRFF